MNGIEFTTRGIDLDARAKYNHQHGVVTDESVIKNDIIRRLYHAQKKFFTDMRARKLKALDGSDVVFNPMSLPLGLPKDKEVIVLLYNYITLEEGRPLAAHDRSGFTATHSGDIPNLVCCTLEMARLALGDSVYYGCVLGDAHPVAFHYESDLVNHVGQELADEIMWKWKDEVLSILFEQKQVRLAIGSTTALGALTKLHQDLEEDFQDLLEESQEKYISSDNTEYKPGYHPSSIYQKGKQSNMKPKCKGNGTFFTNIIKAFDPTLPPCTMFEEFLDNNSPFFELCQRAYLQGCSNGGTSNWNLTKAALDKKARGENLSKEENERVQNWETFCDARDARWEAISAALDKKSRGIELSEEEDKLVQNWEKKWETFCDARDNRTCKGVFNFWCPETWTLILSIPRKSSYGHKEFLKLGTICGGISQNCLYHSLWCQRTRGIVLGFLKV